MTIKYNDFVKINFNAKLKDTGEIFDTTRENIAKKNNIIIYHKYYHPVIFHMGFDDFLPYLEQRIIGLEVGDKKTIEVPCEEAFGKRDLGLIQSIPLETFKRDDIEPTIGTNIKINNLEGMIIAADEDEVKIDFNDPLAGEDVIYEIEVLDIIRDDEEKIMGIIENHYQSPELDLRETKVSIEDDTVKINLGQATTFDQRSVEEVSNDKFSILLNICASIDNIEKVQFIEEYELPDGHDMLESSEESKKNLYDDIHEDLPLENSMVGSFAVMFDEALTDAVEEIIREDSSEQFEEVPEEVLHTAISTAYDDAMKGIKKNYMETNKFDFINEESFIGDTKKVIKNSFKKVIMKEIEENY